jgi:hypothetical protein
MMPGLKTITIIAALLAGGASIASAQNGLPTGGYPSVAGGANGNPAVPTPYLQPAAPLESVARARHYKGIYMSTRRHKRSY